MQQHDMWKDRFFFKATGEDSKALCRACKEDMGRAFYVRGDEEGAFKWRPGKANDCWWRNCKIYSWESFEEEYHEDYIQDIKTEEFVLYLETTPVPILYREEHLELCTCLARFGERVQSVVPSQYQEDSDSSDRSQ